MKSIVLMYHGLYESDTDFYKTITDEDRPYAISVEKFRWQMEEVKKENSKFSESKSIAITFDDGHFSNYSIALPVLQELGLSAYFFVTTDFIVSRKYFCRPEHVRELHEKNMIIGSHGVSHQFLDVDLSAKELQNEFQQSKDSLEQITGNSINSISFPGGRYCKEGISIAQKIGYDELFGSKVGINTDTSKDLMPVMRVAIRNSMDNLEFSKIIAADKNYYAKAMVKHTLKTGLRKTLGNRLYHGLYKSIAG